MTDPGVNPSHRRFFARRRAERPATVEPPRRRADLLAECQRLTTELERAHVKLRGLFDLSPLGIALNSLSDARFVDANEALLTMLGHSHAELTALCHRDICPIDQRPEVARQRDRMLATGRYGPYETELLHKDGHRVAVQLSGMRVVLPDGGAHIWSVVQNIEPRKHMERQLRDEARTDRLTGLPNRALLMEQLQRAAGRYALLFIDFDRFKFVNDTLGHDTGDKLLRLIADRLREAMRGSDVLGADGNVIARLGGDEFVVLLRNVRDAAEAEGVASRLLGLFSQPYFIGHKEIRSSASIGIVVAEADVDTADSALRKADMAMYEAKRAGRSTLAFFDDSMLTRLTRSVHIEEALRGVVERGELSLVYQPIVDLQTGALCSAEALVRWQHPELGAVSPAEFVPIAEDAGLIVAIGDWVLAESCRQWRRWQDEAPQQAPAVISVNVSRVQLGDGAHLIERVAAVIAECRMAPGALQLEVTEREVMRDPAAARELMHRLRALGVRLAMDDFGTGTSSLGCLRDYPFDVIKIDKSFIDDLAAGAGMLAVIHATVTLVENLGMVGVAEGIEQEFQVGLLQSLGCRFGQGYFFSRPVAADRLLAVMARPPGAAD